MLDALETNGFAILPQTISQQTVQAWALSLEQSLEESRNQADTGTLTSRNVVYGSRNLLETWPEVLNVAKHPVLATTVQTVLGNEAGLVRTLYFDKPPGRSWSLPWHRDLTIAVQEHHSEQRDANEFRCPTTKAGIPHVEAPRWLLEKMLTLRVHLDPMTETNGALVVYAGSHRNSAAIGEPPSKEDITTIHCPEGAVLAMRPLLSHSSLHSAEHSLLRRRILHFEFAAQPELPNGYRWHTFIP